MSAGLIVVPLPFRHRIVTRPAPRMAAANPFRRQPASLQETVHLQRFDSVTGTCGIVSAIGAQPRRDGEPVKPHQLDQRPRERFAQRVGHQAAATASDANRRIAVSIEERPVLRVGLR